MTGRRSQADVWTWVLYLGMMLILAFFSYRGGYRDGERNTQQKLVPLLQQAMDDLVESRLSYHQSMETWLIYIRVLTGLDENTTLQERVDRVWQKFCMDPLEG